MKRLLVITIVLLGYHIYAIGQNWDLFPKNQYSLFELSFNNQPSFIERIVKDSAVVSNDSTVHYFNSKIINDSNCLLEIPLKDIFERNYNSYLKLDSYVEKNNWYYFNDADFVGSVQLKFNALAKVNDSWTISGNITFKCDSVSERLVFGQLDSVKYFSNSKVAIPFVLSKNFGLIEFAPFSQLIMADPYDMAKVKLIGYEKTGLKKGTSVPDFSDFFHLKTGDVVFWHYYEEYYNTWELPKPPTDFYYKDSITNSTITEDSVIYDINTIRGNSIIKSTQKFYRDKFSRFLDAGSIPGIFSDENPVGRNTNSFQYWQSPKMARKDDVFSMDLAWGSLLIRPDICRLDRLMDAGEYFSFDTRVGLSAYSFATAVGSIINGEKWGITKIPTGISRIDDPTFRVYPNPCFDKIIVQLNGTEKFYYKLFNSNGQLVKAGQLTDHTIGLNDLPNGLYNLQIGNDKMQESRKIVKVNRL
ncbi:MAG TPA: T9SS type A sorting domain-containing protein [Prolixibacteraceae bacterium]|nr:T9SS type A sorting domain-containing protein [Prolixibacteraceae bacterium]